MAFEVLVGDEEHLLSLLKMPSTGGESGFPVDSSTVASQPTCVNPSAAPCCGMRFVLHLLTAMRALLADRNRLAMESLAIRYAPGCLK